MRRVALSARQQDGVLEMLLFNRLGRREGVLEMLLFNRLGGRKFSDSATLLSKIDVMQIIAKFGVDTAENGLLKVCQTLVKS